MSVILSGSVRKRHNRLVANLLRTCWRLPRLQVSYGETGVMDFVLYTARPVVVSGVCLLYTQHSDFRKRVFTQLRGHENVKICKPKTNISQGSFCLVTR